MKRHVSFIVSLLAVIVAIGLAGTLQTSRAQDYSAHVPVLAYAEIITDPGSGEAGRVVWLRQDLGNKQLAHDFVYGDPRRMAFNGGHPDITFAVDTGYLSGDAGLADQVGWFYNSIGKWHGQTCASIALRENGVAPGSTGAVAAFYGYGTGQWPVWFADITQVGFFSDFFTIPDLGPNVLGVTFTLLWDDGTGNLTDIDGNGKFDVAFREIYYNDSFEWVDNGVQGARGDGVFDFPAVAIHEVGHGFSQAHFGNIGTQNGVLVTRPDAIMNAIYNGIKRDLHGTDSGGFCSNWAQWPNR